MNREIIAYPGRAECLEKLEYYGPPSKTKPRRYEVAQVSRSGVSYQAWTTTISELTRAFQGVVKEYQTLEIEEADLEAWLTEEPPSFADANESSYSLSRFLYD